MAGFDILGYLNSTGAGQGFVSGADRQFVNPAAQSIATPKPSFWGNLGHQVAALPGEVGHLLVDPTVHFAQGLYGNIAGNLGTIGAQGNLDQRNNQLSMRMSKLTSDYKSGAIDKNGYTTGLRQLQTAGQKLSSDAATVANMHRAGYGEVAGNVVPLLATAATIAAPFAAPAEAATAAAADAALAAPTTRAGMIAAKAAETAKAGLNATSAEATPMGALRAAPGIVGRNALVTQPVVAMPGQIAGDVKTGNTGDLALNAAALAAPAIVKGAQRLGAVVTPALRDAMFGRAGFFSAMKDAGGPDLLAHLDSLAGQNNAGKVADTLRQVQDYNLSQFNGDAKTAGQHFVQYLESRGKPASAMSPQEVVSNLQDWVKANKVATDLHEAGQLSFVPGGQSTKELLKPGQTVIAGRFNNSDAKNLVTALSGTNNYYERQAVLDRLSQAGADWAKNPHVKEQVYKAIQNDDYASAIHDVGTMPALFNSGGKKLPGGYFPTVSNNARATFKAAKDTAALDRGVAPNPILGKVGDALMKAGLSPFAVDNSVIRGSLTKSLQTEMDARGIPGDAKNVLSSLEKTNKRGGLDARNLSKNDITGALGSQYADHSANIQKALKSAYANLPRQLVGAGPAALNKVIENVPGMATYLRAQNIGRYEANPIFRIKQYVKSGIVAGVEGARPGLAASKEDMAALQDAGLLTAKGGRAGSDIASSDVGATGNKLMDPVIKNLLGRTAAAIAQAHGTTVREILSSDSKLADEMKQSLGLVTSYGKGGFLNSPMMKTLNLILFPAKFESKVAMEMGKAFSKASPITQIAVGAGIANMNNFLSSPEGKSWQQNNSELIGLIKYFTPLSTVDNISKFLGNGYHVGDLAELGGMPLGVISQILQHQGVDMGQLGGSVYKDPKTNQPVPTNIPLTVRARMQQGLTDLLGSMYSWPGKTAGITSKTTMTQTAVPFLKPGKGETQYQLQGGAPAPSLNRKSGSNIPAAAVNIRPGTVPGRMRTPATQFASNGRATRPKIYAAPYTGPSPIPRPPSRRLGQ